jgi:lipopolysaccharide export system protein LptA
MKPTMALLAIGLAVSAAPAPVFAQDSGQVDIEASEMEILETDKKAIFRGNVVAKRPSDTIACEEMVVTYADDQSGSAEGSTRVQKIDCKSAVSIKTSSQNITGDLAQFFLLKDELIVTGNVKVVQGKTVIRGPRLTVDLKSKRTRMSGGRVKGSFTPQ